MTDSLRMNLRDRYHHGDLRQAMVAAGLALAREGGPQAVVLREVSRLTPAARRTKASIHMNCWAMRWMPWLPLACCRPSAGQGQNFWPGPPCTAWPCSASTALCAAQRPSSAKPWGCGFWRWWKRAFKGAHPSIPCAAQHKNNSCQRVSALVSNVFSI